MESNQKWLLALLHSITPVQWFFLCFGAITVFFVRLMMDHQNKMSQRNFKKDDGGNSRKNELIVVDSNQTKELTKKD